MPSAQYARAFNRIGFAVRKFIGMGARTINSCAADGLLRR